MLSNTTDDGFYDLQHGQDPDIVHVRGLCRGDVNQTTCQNCLNDAKTRLPTLCPNQKEAFGYYDFCTLYYASNRRRRNIGTQPPHSYNNPTDAKDKEKYTSALTDLMQRLKSQASGESDFKVAVGGKVADESENVYGLVQCSPDLSTKECSDCLDDAMSEIPVCCRNKIGGRVIKLDCNLRFETVHFYYDI
ncbi:cysteine-rich receptor-like protein kinase 26 [Neltuma alba]|uniref:cysteine-rich receptor-like protein kinase 26 n=1 Tax=Neltuma alba TaxID=207710 RepID=UPI0010A3081B|nr:cysteine-rich receptor-like protein kinase 26 [Prosopis alba]